jgi:FkbH-like protein
LNLTYDRSHLDYLRLLKASRKLDRSHCTTKLRVAVLADFATQHLVPLLDVLFARSGVAATFYAGEYDTAELDIYREDSELHAFGADVVLLFGSTNALRLKYYEYTGDRTRLGEELASKTASLWDALKRRSTAVVIQSNYVLPYERQFGNYDQKVPEALHSVVSVLNFRLAELARARSNVLINDLEAIAGYVGKKHWLDEKLWTLGKALCALEHLPLVAQNCVDIALSTLGRGVKCVVLDLDNTLWGGVVGDDGLQGIALGHFGEGEPFHRFQQFLRELKRRGIILAVCSKNEHEAAMKPFREHPEMVLREEDIAVFVANWDTKVDNLKVIQRALNIGFDTMVFVDDNPFERNMVRQYLPDVIVPELPEEPSDYVRTLCELNLFETSSFTDEDRQRAQQYREESSRKLAEQTFTDVDDYLRSLEMRISIGRFDAFHLPRIAQLIQRSNQFNLTTRRQGEAECEALMNAGPDTQPLFVKLSDRYGDHGLISVVVLRFEQKHALIDTWVMSCRVLSRGVEQHVMNRVVALTRERGLSLIVGEYLPTAKNKMVKDFFERFGFHKTREEPTGVTSWALEVASYVAKPTHLDEVKAEREVKT